MAETEHGGWEDQKRIDVWTYSPYRIDAASRHDLLLHYDRLTDNVKGYDRYTICNHPKYALEAGFKMLLPLFRPLPGKPNAFKSTHVLQHALEIALSRWNDLVVTETQRKRRRLETGWDYGYEISFFRPERISLMNTRHSASTHPEVRFSTDVATKTRCRD